MIDQHVNAEFSTQIAFQTCNYMQSFHNVKDDILTGPTIAPTVAPFFWSVDRAQEITIGGFATGNLPRSMSSPTSHFPQMKHDQRSGNGTTSQGVLCFKVPVLMRCTDAWEPSVLADYSITHIMTYARLAIQQALCRE